MNFGLRLQMIGGIELHQLHTSSREKEESSALLAVFIILIIMVGTLEESITYIRNPILDHLPPATLPSHMQQFSMIEACKKIAAQMIFFKLVQKTGLLSWLNKTT